MSANLDQNQSMAEFLAKYPVTISLEDAPENPSMEGSRDSMLNYYVTLSLEGRHMSLYFSTGLGWIETRTGQRAPQNITYRKRDKAFLERRGNTLHDANDGKTFGKYRIKKPTAADVLDCLASDASGIDGNDFENWAGDLGYDTDSRKALATFETCQKQAKELRQLLGSAAYDELLNQTEHM